MKRKVLITIRNYTLIIISFILIIIICIPMITTNRVKDGIRIYLKTNYVTLPKGEYKMYTNKQTCYNEKDINTILDNNYNADEGRCNSDNEIWGREPTYEELTNNMNIYSMATGAPGFVQTSSVNAIYVPYFKEREIIFYDY